ncbi:Ppx/GppA phosphatase family protein [Streptomyces sp. 8N706]|uniref:Ppx/GppA phosphatase family protein n=1 Tax=Streptomyces sp. 8N706 TaxID=3457416 RepID=UPI003FD455D0
MALQELASLPTAERANLPGNSAARARQSLAGAVVAHTVMKLTGIDTLTISPWALPEGILLKHLETGDPNWWSQVDCSTPETNRAPAMLRPAASQ